MREKRLHRNEAFQNATIQEKRSRDSDNVLSEHGFKYGEMRVSGKCERSGFTEMMRSKKRRSKKSGHKCWRCNHKRISRKCDNGSSQQIDTATGDSGVRRNSFRTRTTRRSGGRLTYQHPPGQRARPALGETSCAQAVARVSSAAAPLRRSASRRSLPAQVASPRRRLAPTLSERSASSRYRVGSSASARPSRSASPRAACACPSSASSSSKLFSTFAGNNARTYWAGARW